jgi:hypothetical protein
MELALHDATLLEIKSVCAENNIDLVLFVAPYINKKVVGVGRSVLNYSDVFSNSAYFYDTQHINQKGKTKLTEIFIKDVDKADSDGTP